MFGSDINRYDQKKIKESQSGDDELELYLQQRNSAIGEETKSLNEYKEEIAMEEYMRLRNQAYGKPKLPDLPKTPKEEPGEDLESYLAERNKTMNDKLSKLDDESELEVYMRKRKQIFEEG